MDKVVEPSEIIVDQPSINEDVKHINPWNRFIARLFDYAILSFILSFTKLKGYAFFNLIPLKYLIWVPIEAILMSTLGYTPGKFFLKIKVLYNRRRMSLIKSFKRSFLVWSKGIGLGIPIIMPIIMIMSYQHLYHLMKTKWDLQENISTIQKPVSLRTIAVIALLLVVYEFSSF